MKFTETNLENKELPFALAHHAAETLGFVHAEQWDYERAMFDYKIVHHEGTFYLRVPAYAVKGDMPHPSTRIKLMTPVLGKYYYPHGIEYEDEHFPTAIIDKCRNKLDLFAKTIEQELQEI